MSTLYKVEVYSGQWQADGVFTLMSVGQPITVDGTLMVRLGHGTIVEAAGWHATQSEAKAEAAAKIEELAARLAGQALLMRAEVTNATAS